MSNTANNSVATVLLPITSGSFQEHILKCKPTNLPLFARRYFADEKTKLLNNTQEEVDISHAIQSLPYIFWDSAEFRRFETTSIIIVIDIIVII